MPSDDSPSRPFERSGAVGDPVDARWGTVEVGQVAGSTRIGFEGSTRVTGGAYVVVPITFTAADEPQLVSYVAVRDTRGRIFRAGSSRNPYRSGGAAQPGVPRRMVAAVELPADAVPGAELVVTLPANDDDHRRDDLVVIDLGLTAADADAWATEDEVLMIDGPTDGRVESS